MTKSRKILLVGFALAAVVAGVAGAAAHRGGFGMHGGGGFGGRHGGDVFGFLAHPGPICSGRGTEMADIMMVRLEHRLKTTDAQKPALADLKTVLRAGVAKVEAGCPPRRERAVDGTRPPRPTPPERLANLEAGLAARLDAIRSVRPVAERFYAALSDEQKATLMEGGRKHHGGNRGWRMRDDDRNDDGREQGRELGREPGNEGRRDGAPQ